jgi:hypothetical protein
MILWTPTFHRSEEKAGLEFLDIVGPDIHDLFKATKSPKPIAKRNPPLPGGVPFLAIFEGNECYLLSLKVQFLSSLDKVPWMGMASAIPEVYKLKIYKLKT